ncbi:MAG: hypothetical protein ACRETU_03675 [Steroidobacterales bacterium]
MSERARDAPGPRGHEVADVHWRRIVLAAAGLAGVLVAVVLAAMGVHSLLRPGRAAEPPAARAGVGGPRLQSTPANDLQALRAEKDAMLDQYLWLDRPRGVVRIPIERAMQRTAERYATARRGGERRTESAQ